MAHRIEQRGETVERLAVIDAPAPGAPSVPDDATLVLWFVEDLGLGFDPAGVDVEERRRLAALPAAEQLDRALTIARQRLGRDLGVCPADLAATWEVFRGCGGLPCLLGTGGLRRPGAAAGGAGTSQRVPRVPGEPRRPLGWAARTTGRITEQVLDADHRGVLTGSCVRAVANALTAPTGRPMKGGNHPWNRTCWSSCTGGVFGCNWWTTGSRCRRPGRTHRRVARADQRSPRRAGVFAASGRRRRGARSGAPSGGSVPALPAHRHPARLLGRAQPGVRPRRCGDPLLLRTRTRGPRRGAAGDRPRHGDPATRHVARGDRFRRHPAGAQ
ncbi:hypothetical protein NKG94_49250 [Micromonospora sp. M12]